MLANEQEERKLNVKWNIQKKMLKIFTFSKLLSSFTIHYILIMSKNYSLNIMWFTNHCLLSSSLSSLLKRWFLICCSWSFRCSLARYSWQYAGPAETATKWKAPKKREREREKDSLKNKKMINEKKETNWNKKQTYIFSSLKSIYLFHSITNLDNLQDSWS